MRRVFARGVERIVRFSMPYAARLTRPLTMGVRGIVFDAQGRVCLVRHSYVQGWHLPGGGVEPRETLHQALVREIREETGLAVAGRPELFGVYLNERMARRDHVAVYVVRDYAETDFRPSPLEIAEYGFHAPDALPEGTAAPTRRRLAEVLGTREQDHLW